jgi:hypothetical protein
MSTTTAKASGPKAKRKRLRDKLIQVRVSTAELAKATESADRVGLTVASFARQRLVGPHPSRAVQRPPIDRVIVARLLATLGPIASDIRALTRNATDVGPATTDVDKLDQALTALIDMREMAMKALRREP